jgi:hypothetical protein
VISADENSNKFPKTRFWKEKLVEVVVTIGSMAQATLVNSKSTLKGSTLSIQSQLTEKEDPIVEPFETCMIWLGRRYSMPPLPTHTTLRGKQLVYLEGTLYP